MELIKAPGGAQKSLREVSGGQRGARFLPVHSLAAPRPRFSCFPPRRLQVGASEWPVGVREGCFPCGVCLPAVVAAQSGDSSRQVR